MKNGTYKTKNFLRPRKNKIHTNHQVVKAVLFLWAE